MKRDASALSVRARDLVPPLLAVAGAVLVFLLCYRYDNKYNTPSPQPRGGLLLLDEAALDQHPVLFPINDWILYPGLLTPEELHADPMRYGKSIFIGQYTDFALGDPAKAPHGSATMLLDISIPEAPRGYRLELPEIYSAYNLYINGELLAHMGNPSPDHYRPQTMNTDVMFTASGHIEIVLAITDYSHFYSGFVYPPAFGEPVAVARLLDTRLFLRSCVVAVACALGAFYLILGLLLRRGTGSRGLAVLYGLLCLCFVGYTCYPVVKTLFQVGLWWYAVESFCYCAMLSLTMLAQSRLCDYQGRGAYGFPIFGGLVSVAALFLPAIAQGGLSLMHAWSRLVSFYFILCAFYLTATAAYGLLCGSVRSRVMLCGALVFDSALVMDRLLPDYEPIYTGWFAEWAGLTLVLCTGILIGQNIISRYQQHRALEENMSHMRGLMETQQAHYSLVLEQAEQARAARHDLRHHLSAVQGFAAQGDNEGLAVYLEEYVVVSEPTATVFCDHPILNMVLSQFAARARAAAVSFDGYADTPAVLEFSDTDLFAILANLLENAMEGVRMLPQGQRWIRVSVMQASGVVAITVDNSFDGIMEEKNGGLVSRKRPGQPGIGTTSVRRIAEKYGGTANWRWENTGDSGVFYAEILLPIRSGG